MESGSFTRARQGGVLPAAASVSLAHKERAWRVLCMSYSSSGQRICCGTSAVLSTGEDSSTGRSLSKDKGKHP